MTAQDYKTLTEAGLHESIAIVLSNIMIENEKKHVSNQELKITELNLKREIEEVRLSLEKAIVELQLSFQKEMEQLRLQGEKDLAEVKGSLEKQIEGVRKETAELRKETAELRKETTEIRRDMKVMEANLQKQIEQVKSTITLRLMFFFSPIYLTMVVYFIKMLFVK